MIFPTRPIDNLLFIMNQGNLVYDLSKFNSILLDELLFIGDQVKLEGNLSKFSDIPRTFHR